MVLASDAGWYAGLGIGFLVVVVVVVVVAAILTFVQRIIETAQRAVHGLEEACLATQPIWKLADVNDSAREALEALRTARERMEEPAG